MPESGLTRVAVAEFQRLMREDCGVELTIEQAWSRATQLVTLYRMLMGPIPEDPEVRTSEHLTCRTVDESGVLQ